MALLVASPSAGHPLCYLGLGAAGIAVTVYEDDAEVEFFTHLEAQPINPALQPSL
jgi:hypothetical protein